MDLSILFLTKIRTLLRLCFLNYWNNGFFQDLRTHDLNQGLFQDIRTMWGPVKIPSVFLQGKMKLNGTPWRSGKEISMRPYCIATWPLFSAGEEFHNLYLDHPIKQPATPANWKSCAWPHWPIATRLGLCSSLAWCLWFNCIILISYVEVDKFSCSAII